MSLTAIVAILAVSHALSFVIGASCRAAGRADAETDRLLALDRARRLATEKRR